MMDRHTSSNGGDGQVSTERGSTPVFLGRALLG
jgi:hypothetical protein